MRYLKHKWNLNFRQGKKFLFYSKVYLIPVKLILHSSAVFSKREKGLNVYIPVCIGILLTKSGRKKVDIYVSPIAYRDKQMMTPLKAPQS